MSKAVLIMDMPKKCKECQLAENQYGGYWYCNALHEYTTFIKFKESRPLKCPLRPMPKKKENACSHGYAGGYNACIDAIGGVDGE